MALEYVTLRNAALAFRVHPRTIVRAIKGVHNTYWTEDIDDDYYSIEEIAKSYGIRPAALRAVFEGRDVPLRADEAAKELGMAARTFRKHMKKDMWLVENRGRISRYGRISHGGIVRYLQSRTRAAAIDRTPEE